MKMWLKNNTVKKIKKNWENRRREKIGVGANRRLQKQTTDNTDYKHNNENQNPRKYLQLVREDNGQYRIWYPE